MDRTLDTTVQALQQLARAVANEGDARKTNAQRAASAFGRIEPSAWLPQQEVQYYLGLAEFYSDNLDAADRHLGQVPPESPCAGEALWVRAQIIVRRISGADGERLRPQLFERYQRLAEVRPLCAMTQSVADRQTDEREASAGGDLGPRAVPVTKLGRRYDWQTLVRIGELYARQNLLVDAARAYGWSVEVRYPQEWLSGGVAASWMSIADCHERLGDRHLAFRWLAKCLALPLDSGQIQQVVARLARLPESTPPPPPTAQPDARTLMHIGEWLLEMEMFDQAVVTYQQAGRHGADVGVPLGKVLEARAAFLFDYRAERSPYTMLLGQALTWARVAGAFEAARKQYAEAGPLKPEAAAGMERCDRALERIQAQGADVSRP